VNGKIPLDEKPRGNLVMCERNCLRLKNPCFKKECLSFLCKCTFKIMHLVLNIAYGSHCFTKQEKGLQNLQKNVEKMVKVYTTMI
jgi:hypothetical protein